MGLLHRAFALSLPAVPKALVERFSAPYIAGHEIGEAMAIVAEIERRGMVATIDVLGEFVENEAQADETRDEYLRAITAIGAADAAAGVSIKLTAFGLLLSEAACYRRVREVVEAAASVKRFVRIDMEDSPTTDATLAIYERLRREGHANVGVVLQAMLRRSVADARRLLQHDGLSVRVCKGIYVEPYEVAFHDPVLVRESYLRICEELLAGGAKVGAATHDERLVYGFQALCERHDPRGERHELQMLLGVRPPLRDLLVEQGERVRIYVPYGREAHAYGVRRLQENPQVARHVVRDVATRLVRRGKG